MSTLPFLPILTGELPALEFTPGTYSALVTDTLGVQGTDGDGMPLAIGDLAVATAAFEADLPNLDADIAAMPTGGPELDPIDVSETLLVLDDAEIKVDEMAGTPGLVTDANITPPGGGGGGGNLNRDCPPLGYNWDKIIDMGTYAPDNIRRTITIPSGAGLHPGGRNYVWFAKLEAADPDIFGLVVEDPNTFGIPPRIAYLIMVPLNIGLFSCSVTIVFIDDTHLYHLCFKVAIAGPSAHPEYPDFAQATQGLNVALDYDGTIDMISNQHGQTTRRIVLPGEAGIPSSLHFAECTEVRVLAASGGIWTTSILQAYAGNNGHDSAVIGVSSDEAGDFRAAILLRYNGDSRDYVIGMKATFT
jgi:hypothetical protein